MPRPRSAASRAGAHMHPSSRFAVACRALLNHRTGTTTSRVRTEIQAYMIMPGLAIGGSSSHYHGSQGVLCAVVGWLA